VSDVANYLRLQPETVRMMARAKKIPAIKIGKSWRFYPQIIQDWWMK
jgi:excisionase family DNA binding protein